jgi:hypothetical protein
MSDIDKIVESIIRICNESVETDVLSEGLKCECGKAIKGTQVDLWEPISRVDTIMMRNTLQSMLK